VSQAKMSVMVQEETTKEKEKEGKP